jgi:hypothetical protein
MVKQRALALEEGMSPSEFVATIAPALWQAFDASLKKFIEASGGQHSPVAETAAQQQHMRAYVAAERELVRLGMARLSAEPHQVSGILKGTAHRVLIEPELVLSLTNWDLKRGTLLDPHGRSFEFVKIQPLRAARGSKPQYDWGLLQPLVVEEAKRGKLKKPATLVRFCREQVVLCDTGKKPEPLPDDKTVRQAISKYGLDEIAQIKMRKSG